MSLSWPLIFIGLGYACAFGVLVWFLWRVFGPSRRGLESGKEDREGQP